VHSGDNIRVEHWVVAEPGQTGSQHVGAERTTDAVPFF
jgi:hypothetical protein